MDGQHLRIARGNNWGLPVTITGREERSCARIHLDQGEADVFAVYGSADVVQDPAGGGPYHAAVRVSWGEGSASVVQTFQITAPRWRVPIVGSSLEVTALLVDKHGAPPPLPPAPGAQARANVTAFIARGTDSLPTVPAYWPETDQMTGAALVSRVPGSLLSVRATNGDDVDRTLMFFDLPGGPVPPPNGTAPLIAFPLGKFPDRNRLSETFSNGLPFLFSLTWAVSSVQNVLSFVPGAHVTVYPELMQ